MVALRIHELVYECEKRKIILDPEVKYKSYDYLELLGNHTLIERYGNLNNVPFAVQYRFNLKSLMLSKNFKDLKPDQQYDVLKNPSKNWIAEYKHVGNRVIIIYHPDTGFHFFGRDISEYDHLPVDYTDKILFVKNGKVTKPSSFKGVFPKPFVFDGEITFLENADTSSFYVEQRGLKIGYDSNPVSKFMSIEDIEFCYEIQMTQASLQFKIFDILYYDKEIKNIPLEIRKNVQEQLVNNLSKYNLPFSNSEVFTGDFESLFKNHIEQGGEGLILKNLKKPYLDSSSRKSDYQVKLKKDMLSHMKEEQLDFDVFISGYQYSKNINKCDNFEEINLISLLQCSIYIKKPDGTELEHEVCNISLIPVEIKKEITGYNEKGKPVLKKEYLGKVLSVNGYNMSSKLKFDHVVCEVWDFNKDKSKYECVIDEEELIELVV